LRDDNGRCRRQRDKKNKKQRDCYFFHALILSDMPQNNL
jgi:hypothetical protein